MGLTTGLEIIGRHLWLVALSVVLDLLPWLGPRRVRGWFAPRYWAYGDRRTGGGVSSPSDGQTAPPIRQSARPCAIIRHRTGGGLDRPSNRGI